MKFFLGILSALLLAAFVCRGGEWFVSTNGTGNGSFSNPWSLQTALTNTAVKPGDTIWLRGGAYSPVLTNRFLNNGGMGWVIGVSGNIDKPITIRSYTNEWAVLDRPWLVGSFIRFRDLEFWDSYKGMYPTNDIPNGGRGPWLHFILSTNPGNEWINCVIHDVHNGWSKLRSTETVRGCIMWYVGWEPFEHVHYPNPLHLSGSIIAFPHNKTLNNSGDYNTTCNSNIIFGAFEMTGLGGYADINVGGDGAALEAIGNVVFTRRGPNLAVESVAGTVISNNIFAGATRPALLHGTNGVFGYNTVFSFGNLQTYFASNDKPSWTVDKNNYYHTNVSTFAIDGTYRKTWTDWQALGFDLSGSTNVSVPPDAVRVMPNGDEPRRCHIAICNWSRKHNVEVSLSGVLNAGDTYKLFSAQNYKAGPIRTGKYDGTSILVPMTNLTTAPLLSGTNMNYHGEVPTQPQPTTPEFGAFVLIGAGPMSTTKVPKVTGLRFMEASLGTN